MFIPLITSEFPDPNTAGEEGIVGYSYKITANQILKAYRIGIFPMAHEMEELFWYSPDPRWVMHPNQAKVHKSMRKVMRDSEWHVTVDCAFREVIKGCAQGLNRKTNGTWIDQRIFNSYTELHEKGFAHSVEVWQQETLIGGLYGVSVGKIFCGESMFTLKPNASKYGFLKACQFFTKLGIKLIDCQMHTPHLESLGAYSISRPEYLHFLAVDGHDDTYRGSWATAFEEWNRNQ